MCIHHIGTLDCLFSVQSVLVPLISSPLPALGPHGQHLGEPAWASTNQMEPEIHPLHQNSPRDNNVVKLLCSHLPYTTSRNIQWRCEAVKPVSLRAAEG